MALRIVVEIQEDVNKEAGAAEAVRLLRQVGDRIGDGADKGYIQGADSLRARAEWSTATPVASATRGKNQRA